jgi:carbonic anhydrase
MDLELHIVHSKSTANRPDNKPDNYKYAVFGILFDTVNYDSVEDWVVTDLIDPMFDALNFGNITTSVKNHSVYKINENKVGNLLNYMEQQDRWTYDGSLTTPPCSTLV